MKFYFTYWHITFPSLTKQVMYTVNKFKLSYDRRSVGQSVLVSSHHLGPGTNFPFFTQKFETFAVFFLYGEPSLTRGRVCNLSIQLVLVLASAVTLPSKSRRALDHISLSHLRPGSNFCRLLRLAGLRWRYSSPPPHGGVVNNFLQRVSVPKQK
jgi:hypothetical protein